VAAGGLRATPWGSSTSVVIYGQAVSAMIRRVEVLGYRCLKHVSVELGPFMVLVGPNGSGKSALFDALAFVRDVLMHGPEAAVLDPLDSGRRPARASYVKQLSWARERLWVEIAVDMAVPPDVAHSGLSECRYELRVGMAAESSPLGVLAEAFWVGPAPPNRRHSRNRQEAPDTIRWSRGRPGWRRVAAKTPTGSDRFVSESGDFDHTFRSERSRAALANMPDDRDGFPIAMWARNLLRSTLMGFDLRPEAMRSPARTGRAFWMAEDGSNLAGIVSLMGEDEHRAWIHHLGTFLDVRDVRTYPVINEGTLALAVTDGSGLEVYADGLSAGTLRSLALTALAYADRPPWSTPVYLIEEPENGVHPQAIEAIRQSLSSIYGGQVFLATHSPVLVAMCKPEELLCFSRADDGSTVVTPGHQHPRLRQWQGDITLGDLFAAGILG